MIFRRCLVGALLLVAIALSAGAQQSFPLMTDTTGMRHPCTGEVVPKYWTQEYSPTGETITCTVLGVSRSWNTYDINMIPQTEKSEFIHGVIGLAGQNCGSGGSASLTQIASAATFKQAIFTDLAKPRMATTSTQISASAAPVAVPAPAEGEAPKAVELEAAQQEAGKTIALPPNNVTTDLEYSFFSQNKTGGNSIALRAGYSRTPGESKLTYGGMLVINTMIMLDKIFLNNALNAYGTYMLSESANLERRIGGSLNMFLVPKDFYGTPFGMSIVANFSDNWFVDNDNILTYGLMAQQSFVGDIKTTLLTAGVLYGLPISERFALNANLVYALNALTIGKNGVVDITNRNMLQPGVTWTTYFTRLFSLDAGLKTTLLVQDYSDIIITLGSVILF